MQKPFALGAKAKPGQHCRLRGQSALEYIMLVAAAIFIVLLIIVLLTGIGGENLGAAGDKFNFIWNSASPTPLPTPTPPAP